MKKELLSDTDDKSFKSRPGHTKPRSSSGVSSIFGESGQESGQNHRQESGQENFVTAIISDVMANNPLRQPLPYKEPFVHIGKNELYVDMTYFSLTKNKYVRQKVRIKEKFIDRESKIKMLQEVCKRLKPELRDRNKRLIYHETITSPKQVIDRNNTVLNWLDIAIADDDHSEDRRRTYSELKSNLVKFYDAHPVFGSTTPAELDRGYVKEFIQYLQGLKRTGKTINKYLGAIQSLCTFLHQNGNIENSFSTEQYRVPQIKNETGRFPPFTKDELRRIFSFYKTFDGGHYNLFLLHIHYSCIRPVEIHRLQRKYYDLENKTIYIPWYKSKNGLSNYVQMFDPLCDALKAMGIDKLHPDSYIFGKELRPSMTLFDNTRYTSEIWNKYREHLSIPKGKTQYGMKHTFNRNFVEDLARRKKEVPWEWLRRHNRHSTVQQTQQYISELTAYFLDSEEYQIPDFFTPDTAIDTQNEP